MSKRLGAPPDFIFHRPTCAAAPPEKAWSVPELCSAYNWPTDLPGGGVIGIFELGGWWIQSDMDQFFAGIGQPVPTIKDVSVAGTKNTPDTGPRSADG